MTIRASFLAALLLAATALPLRAEGPVKSAAEGVVKGTATVVKKTGKGVWCIVTLGYGC
jgi:hypothetical protein